MGVSSVPVYLEGAGDHFSTGNRNGNDETMLVNWWPASGEWLCSDTQHACAMEVGFALHAALANGKVRLKGLWCPNGFSGGGAYLRIQGNTPSVARVSCECK